MGDGSAFFVRSAMAGDLNAVKSLLHESWMATYGDAYGEGKIRTITTQWYTLERLRDQLDAPQSEFVVADEGSRIGGMGYAAMADEKDAVLRQLYVAPQLTGRRIGTQLLLELESAFPQARRVILEVEARNLGAIAFYESHGYSAYGRSTSCCGEFDMPAVNMAKPLDGWDL